MSAMKNATIPWFASLRPAPGAGRSTTFVGISVRRERVPDASQTRTPEPACLPDLALWPISEHAFGRRSRARPHANGREMAESAAARLRRRDVRDPDLHPGLLNR